MGMLGETVFCFGTGLSDAGYEQVPADVARQTLQALGQ